MSLVPSCSILVLVLVCPLARNPSLCSYYKDLPTPSQCRRQVLTSVRKLDQKIMNHGSPTAFITISWLTKQLLIRPTFSLIFSIRTKHATEYLVWHGKTTLAAEFERWKIDKVQYFWAEVIRSKTTVLALTRTETSLIQYSAPLANNTIRESSKRTMEKRSGHTEHSYHKQHRCSSDLNVQSGEMDNSENGEIESRVEGNSGFTGKVLISSKKKKNES